MAIIPQDNDTELPTRILSPCLRAAFERHKNDETWGTENPVAEARALARLGFAVVPCEGKKPIIKGWPDVCLSPNELEAELAGKRLNIAIALNQSDLIDIECDSDDAESALEQLFRDCDCEAIPRTPTYRSKRGCHRLFKRPDGLPNTAKLEHKGIEFRIGNGKGALSVVPPSMHPDSQPGNIINYHWLTDCSIHEVRPAELPSSIIDLLRNRTQTTEEVRTGGEIVEGERNDTLFKKACAMRELELPQGTVLATLQDLNARCCRPPLLDSEVAKIAESAFSHVPPKRDFLSRLLGEVELWHDENKNPFVTVNQEGHREHWQIGKRSGPFVRWLCHTHFKYTDTVLSGARLAEVTNLLEGKAVYEGSRYSIWRRMAVDGELLYFDLCDSRWRAVEISADGWQIVDSPPVRFRRSKAMLALPDPVHPNGVSLWKLLRPFLNVSEQQWPLVAAWLAAALRPIGPFPILKLSGEQGTAKTTTARLLRALVDPNAAPVRSEPRDCRDLMIAANNGWVLCLDNLSSIKQDLSDALCRMATGGGFATRTLYTDDEETIFNAQRPVILTSIEEIGTRSDLLERSLLIELPPIREEERRAEKVFWQQFEQALPKILGALFDVVCSALRRLPEVEANQQAELPRMADFHMWGEACEPGLGLAPGTFAEAYAANQIGATHTVLESSPLVSVLLIYLQKHERLEATATELLSKLARVGADDPTRQSGWPKTPRVLSAILRRVAPNLRQVGIVAEQATRGSGADKEKVWRIGQQ